MERDYSGKFGHNIGSQIMFQLSMFYKLFPLRYDLDSFLVHFKVTKNNTSKKIPAKAHQSFQNQHLLYQTQTMHIMPQTKCGNHHQYQNSYKSSLNILPPRFKRKIGLHK